MATKTLHAALAGIGLLTACAEETSCPAGTQRVEGVCAEASSLDDAGVRDAEAEADRDATDDLDATVAACFLDTDHDGFGGDAVDCEFDDAGSDVAVQAGDCDDMDPARAPNLVESCDGIDNDCDEEIDEGTENACGGACEDILRHEVGAECTNGLLGECARDGVFVCESQTVVVCGAPAVAPSGELCGDDKDNDCDGLIDEPDATNAVLWYQDCDKDGYAASTTGAVKACVKPVDAGDCSWTNVLPLPDTKANWDCNEANSAYSPAADYGFPPVGSSSRDLNCDAELTPDPTPPASRCSYGVIDRLNKSRNDSFPQCITSGQVDCFAWETAEGSFTVDPTNNCGNLPVRIRQMLPEDAACRATPSSQHFWPCR